MTPHRSPNDRTRTGQPHKIKFREYGFDAFYCQPGVEGAHEKGGVEGEGGRFRRNHCVPMPRVDSIAELNELLAAADAKDDHRRIGNRAHTVGHDWQQERLLLRPLPAEPFPTWLTLTPRVDRQARVTVRQCRYSVPARLIGRIVRVELGATRLRIYDRTQLVATHERLLARGGQSLILDHYLEVLARKPGALPGATALQQARNAGGFTATHDAFWTLARARLGDSAGTQALVEVLLLHRRMSPAQVEAGMAAAVRLGIPSPDLVAVEARAAADTPVPAPLILPRGRGQQELSDPAGVLLLPADPRPLPTVAGYDCLLDPAAGTDR